MSYLRQIFALVGVETIEVTKQRVEMGKVNDFVVLFIPHGLFARAGRPLVDAALYLVTMKTTRQHPQAGARCFNPYHRECKGNNSEWDGCEVFMKDNPVVVPVFEPHDVDDFLDNGMSVWKSWMPPPSKVRFLLDNMVLSSLQMAMQ